MITTRNYSQVEEKVNALVDRRASLWDREMTSRDRDKAFAEVAVADFYGLSIKSFLSAAGLWLPVDKQGQKVRVIQRWGSPFTSWTRSLRSCDVQIFVETNRFQADLVGWLPATRVTQAPIVYWMEDGKKKDHGYENGSLLLNPTLTTFEFVEPCAHSYVSKELPGGIYGAIWNYNEAAWNCCGCGRFFHDAATRERVADDLRRDPVPEGEEGD